MLTTAIKPNFQLNSALKVSQLSIGEEGNSVIVIDDFLAEPEALVDYARLGESFQKSPNDYYPGIRKPIDGSYPDLVCRTVAHYFYNNPAVGIATAANASLNKNDSPSKLITKIGLCAFSLATTPPAQLRPIQSLPHFDNSDPFQSAMVHYLCHEAHGGTSFYRHRQTGFESITPQRMQTYAATLKSQVVSAQFPGQAYINGDNDWFERIASIEAKYNRAIIFQGNLLHAGNINSKQSLSDDPQCGRLTANAFISLKCMD
jgi:hypothetical protein